MNPIKTFNVVFDIDDVLAVSEIEKSNISKFFEEKGLVLTAIKTYYVFPGVIEMMQLLFSMPDVRVSFFSSAHQNRNELFVEKLLERALGCERYIEIKKKIQILSGTTRERSTDLIKNTSKESEKQLNQYGLRHGNKKKSLEKVVGQGENLDNCVLIDDDSSWVKYGQEGNFLHVPALRIWDLVDMGYKSKDYVHDERKIPFRDCTSIPNLEYLKDCIMNANYIGLIFEEEMCTLCYVSLDQKKYEEIELSEETDGVLFEAVKKYYQQNESFIEGQSMTKEALDLALYALIDKNNGKTKAINLACNRICYIAGVLFKALEYARSDSTLTKFLFPLHFSPNGNGTFEPRFDTEKACDRKEEYYHYGLEKFKQVNPHFTFINPQIYKESCERDLAKV